MSARDMIYGVVLITLLLTSCSQEKRDSERTHLGGCILLSTASEAPDDLYQVSDIIVTDEYPPFTKKLTVYGLTFIGRDDISDDFMRTVARTVQEIFAQNEAIDSQLQKEVLSNLYKYKAVIPFFKGEDFKFTDAEEEAMDQTRNENSICDIIMQDVPRQVTEVVEHILHHVTNIGFHYTFHNEWGISKTSEIHRAMERAVDQGYYDITQYSDIDDEAARHRVILQEMAYWSVYAAWDLLEPYGPTGEAEWTIKNSTELRTKMPELYQVYTETAAKVMMAPSRKLLDEFAAYEPSDSHE